MGSTCPLCRTLLRRNSNMPSQLLRSAAKIAAEHSSEEVRDSYNQRIKEQEKTNLARRLRNATIGQKIDIMDTENIWCVGVIREINKNPNHCDTYLIHYVGWDQMYDEFICANSLRLAPFGFFTNRNGKITRFA